MKAFTIPAQITSTRPLVDRSMSITFHTKELTSREKLKVIESLNGVGHLLFKEDQIQEKDVPNVESGYEKKSCSQRLRAVLFVVYKETGAEGSFEDFYKTEMEKVINHYKNKL